MHKVAEGVGILVGCLDNDDQHRSKRKTERSEGYNTYTTVPIVLTFSRPKPDRCRRQTSEKLDSMAEMSNDTRHLQIHVGRFEHPS